MKSKRIILAIFILTVAVVSSFVLPSCLAEEPTSAAREIRIKIPSGNVYKEVEFTDAKPFIADESCIMLPVAPLIDAYNQFDNRDQYQITWNDEEHKLTLTKNNDYANRVDFFEGQSFCRKYYPTGTRRRDETPQYDPLKEGYLDRELICAPETINGRMFLPLKYRVVSSFMRSATQNSDGSITSNYIYDTESKFDYDENILYIGEAFYPFSIEFKNENGDKLADNIWADSANDVRLPVLDDTADKRFGGWKALLPSGEYIMLNEWPDNPNIEKDETTYKNYLSESDRKMYVKNGLRDEYDYSWAKTMTLYPIWYDHYPTEEEYASLSDKEFVVPENEKSVLESYYNGYLSSIYSSIDPGTTPRTIDEVETPTGLIAKYINDFDNDDHAEMITLCAIYTEDMLRSDFKSVGSKKNIFLQIYEIGEDGQPCLKDERIVFDNGYRSAARRTVFVHQFNNENYICATMTNSTITEHVLAAKHQLFKYNGNKFERVLCINDPGYEGGSMLYKVPDNTENYYNDGKQIYPGEYNSYNDAIMYEGMKFGLKAADYGTWDYNRYNYDGTTSEESINFKPMYTADNAVWIASIDDTAYEFFLIYSEQKTIHSISINEQL